MCLFKGKQYKTVQKRAIGDKLETNSINRRIECVMDVLRIANFQKRKTRLSRGENHPQIPHQVRFNWSIPSTALHISFLSLIGLEMFYNFFNFSSSTPTLNHHRHNQHSILSADRLTIAQLVVDREVTAKGVISKINLQKNVKFQEFPGLWDALVAGERQMA